MDSLKAPPAGHGMEAVREGVQEYKRLPELRKRGVPESDLDAHADRALSAKSVLEFDSI